MTDFNKLTSESMYSAFVDTMLEQIELLKTSGTKITKKLVDDILDAISKRIELKDSIIFFDNPSCTKINQLFERVIAFTPEFTKSHISKLTRMFHYLDYNFNYYRACDNNNKICAFEAKQLLSLVSSNRLKEDDKSYLIERMASCLFNRKSTNFLIFSENKFEGIDAQTRLTIISKFLKLNLTACETRNLKYLCDFIIQANAREEGAILIYKTAMNKDGRSENIYDHVERISKDEFNNILRLRKELFGSLDNFNTIQNVAESLGCIDDKLYWKGAVVKDSSIALPLPEGLEF